MNTWLLPMAIRIILGVLASVIKNENSKAKYQDGMLQLFLALDESYPEFRKQLP